MRTKNGRTAVSRIEKNLKNFTNTADKNIVTRYNNSVIGAVLKRIKSPDLKSGRR